MGRALVTYAEAAEYLGIPESQLRALVEKRAIPFVRLSKKFYRFDLDALDAHIAASTVPVATSTP